MLETFLHPIFALLSLTDSSQSLGTGSLFLLAQTPAEAAEAAEVAANNWKSFLKLRFSVNFCCLWRCSIVCLFFLFSKFLIHVLIRLG